MKGTYIKPSELLAKQKQTGLSYWDMIGRPLTSQSPEEKKIAQIDLIINTINDQLFPGYKKGKPKGKSSSSTSLPKTGEDYWKLLNAAQRKEMGDFIAHFRLEGFTDTDIAGMLGNAAVESSFYPDIESPGGTYGGLFLNSRTIRSYIKKIYGDLSAKSQRLFVADMMNHKNNLGKEWIAYGSGFKKGRYNTAQQASAAFRAAYERPAKRTYAKRDYYAGLMPYIIDTYFPNLALQQLVQPQSSVSQLVLQQSPLNYATSRTNQMIGLYYPQVRQSIPEPVRGYTDQVVDQKMLGGNGRLSMNPLDMWRAVNEETDYLPQYQYQRGKSFQFPFWNLNWNVLNPPYPIRRR